MRRLATTGLAAGLLLALAPLTTQVSYAATAPSAARAAIDPDTPDGTYTAITPSRFFDSRTDLKRGLKPGEEATIPVLGRAGIPASGVSAVVINLTVNAPQRSGFLAAYPSSSTGAGISNVTFAAGDTRAGLVTVPVGPDGRIKVRNAAGAGAGTANAIVDVQGYYASAAATATTSQAGYFSSSGLRVLDTRDPNVGGALQPFEIIDRDLQFFDDSADEDRVKAVAVNLTAVRPSAAGYLVGYDGSGEEPPATSNVNFVRGATTANNAVIPVRHLTDKDGTRVSSFSVANGSYTGSVDVVVDYVGVYIRNEDGELRFQPLTSPVRIVNTTTRSGFAPLGANQTGTATAPSSVAVPGTTAALVGTLTGVRATAPTFLTAWPFGEEQPEISNLNPAKGQTVSNHAVIALSQDARFNVYNLAGRIDVLFDVAGRFDVPAATGASGATGASSAPAAQRRAVTTAQERFSDVDVTGLDRREWKH